MPSREMPMGWAPAELSSTVRVPSEMVVVLGMRGLRLPGT